MPVQRPAGGWLTGTRGLILAQLCAKRSRVKELAEAVGVTRSAVRAHLERLERDGLVRHSTDRGRVGKPAHIYELTGDGESLLSRGYPVALEALLEAAEGLDAAARAGLLDRAARVLAAARPHPSGKLRARVESAAEMVRELGGVVVVTADGDEVVLRGDCCPLRASSAEHRIACTLMGSVLGRVIGAPVREHCERGRPPHCEFTIGGGGAAD